MKASHIGQTLVLEFFSTNANWWSLNEITDNIDGKCTSKKTGHNFPVSNIPLKHWLRSWLNKNDRYVIAYQKGDGTTHQHELCHARYFHDKEYRELVVKMWENLTKRSSVENLLERMGYANSVWIDEFQAYLATEKDNFFGPRYTEEKNILKSSFNGAGIRKF
jgi:hypothetical protein